MNIRADGSPAPADTSASLSSDDGDDFLDLSFGDEPAAEPADLNVEDMADGTTSTVTDLSSPAPVPADTTGAQQPAPGASSPPAPAAPVTQPTTQQPPAPDPNAAPAAPPAQQPAGGEQPGATDPQPVNFEEFVTANADAIVSNLAATHFKIDDAQAEALQFSPEVKAFVEKRDAKNFMLTMVQVNNALRATLPAVVSQLMTVASEAKKTHEGFFGDFPYLNKPEYVPHLRQLAVTLRGMHPKMPQAEFQALLGNSARAALGTQAPPPQQQQQQQVSGRQVVRRGQPQPFTPAGALQPQRNHGGNGAPQLTGLDFLNAALQTDIE